MGNPLKDWRVDPADITTTGFGLRRPECVLAERKDTLWAADLRGGALGIRRDGSQQLVTPRGGSGPTASEPFVPGIIPDGTEGISLPTVYIGSLLGTTLPTFRSPVPGQPMVHWYESWSS